MRKTLIAMLGLAALALWVFPAVAGTSLDPPRLMHVVPYEGRPGASATLSGTVVRSAAATTTWSLYPGACLERAAGTWAPKSNPVADSLDTYSVGSLGGYTRLDQSLKERLWHVVSSTTPVGERPAILAGTRSLWCGKFDPNWIVDVGYPNLTFQILYIDTGSHAANYTLNFLMNSSTEQNYDFLYLMGGGGNAVDPLQNLRAKFDELISTGVSGTSNLEITWTGTITTGGTISTLGDPVFILGAGAGQPSPVAISVSLAAANRALYFLFTADCLFSSEDGLWPFGQGNIFDSISTTDNGSIYADQTEAGGSDPVQPPGAGVPIVGTFGTAPYVAARVAPGTGALWQIVNGGFSSTSDVCAPEKNDTADNMFFGADASTKKTIPGQYNSIVGCTFPVPAGTASIVATWDVYFDLPSSSGMVQDAEYRFFKGGEWSNWQDTSPDGTVNAGTVKTWVLQGNDLGAATQADSVQVRYHLRCIPPFSPTGVCQPVDYGLLYDNLRLEIVTGVPAPLFGIFVGAVLQSHFVDGTMAGLNCSTLPCWPGIRGSNLPGLIAIKGNVNNAFGDSITMGLITGLRKDGMGINWKRGYNKAINAGETIEVTRDGVGDGFNPAFDVPRVIYRLFDPATLTWSAFDSSEVAADAVSISGPDTILAGTGGPEFRWSWPPFDKAGQNLPGGFTINGVGAYNNLRFLPRGTRMQYYFKAVDIFGGTSYQFASGVTPGTFAREVEDLPTLPGGSVTAPDIVEFNVLPRKYAAGSSGSLLAGRTDSPILNADGAYTAWSAQYDPVTQALRALGVRADRYRMTQGGTNRNGPGGHELQGPPDNQRPRRFSNYIPNMTEYGIKDSLARWYRIIIQSGHLRPFVLDDEADTRLFQEWWETPTGTSGGDRCFFVSGDDYFNNTLNIPAGESGTRRVSFAQNVLGVNSAVGAWNGTATVAYPTVEDRFANPGAGPGLLTGYSVPVDGGCGGPNRFDALTKMGTSDAQNSALYPLFAGTNDVAAVAMHTEKDAVTDNDRNKALGYGFSIQFLRKPGVPNGVAVRGGVEERMKVLYKFLTSCRGARSGAPADTAKCWPCPGNSGSFASMTTNWAAEGAFQTGVYGPLYPIQDHNLVATGVEISDASEAPRVNQLKGNFPNPFNPQTTIRFSSAQAGKVTIRIFSVGGQLVRTLTTKVESGPNEVRWNGKRDDGVSLASGIYFYKVKFADGKESASRMALVK
jgi:hypothetical protein